MSERGDRLARNETLFRSVNERVEEVVQPGAAEEIDFLCECADADCVENISLERQEYERARSDATQFVVAPGHEVPEIEEVIARTDRFLVVRKHPEEADIAQETDPRSQTVRLLVCSDTLLLAGGWARRELERAGDALVRWTRQAQNSRVVVVTTYTIEGKGPYDEDDAREKIRAYCDEHGFHATLTLAVVEIRAGATSGRRVDPGKLLDQLVDGPQSLGCSAEELGRKLAEGRRQASQLAPGLTLSRRKASDTQCPTRYWKAIRVFYRSAETSTAASELEFAAGAERPRSGCSSVTAA